MNDLNQDDKNKINIILSEYEDILKEINKYESDKINQSIDIKSILNSSFNVSKQSNKPKQYDEIQHTVLPQNYKHPFIDNQYITYSYMSIYNGANQCPSPQVKCICVNGKYFLKLQTEMELSLEEKDSQAIQISTSENIVPDYYFNNEFISQVIKYDENDPIDQGQMNDNFDNIWCATTCIGQIRSDILKINLNGWKDRGEDIEFTSEFKKVVDKSKIDENVKFDQVTSKGTIDLDDLMI